MARPRKPASEKRSSQVNIHMTDEQRAVIEELARRADVTLAQYMRTSAAQARVVNRGDWRALTYQLNRIGNNLNQIARWANEHKADADADEIAVALMRLERAVRQRAGFGGGAAAVEAVAQELGGDADSHSLSYRPDREREG